MDSSLNSPSSPLKEVAARTGGRGGGRLGAGDELKNSVVGVGLDDSVNPEVASTLLGRAGRTGDGGVADRGEEDDDDVREEEREDEVIEDERFGGVIRLTGLFGFLLGIFIGALPPTGLA